MIGLVVGAGILGIIVAAMEREEFPGWGKMALCALAAVLPALVINVLLPPELFIVGLLVGAGCSALVISATCGMSLKRASIAAGIYLAIQLVISLVFYLLSGGPSPNVS
jgi:hypothetical protein